jgi:hypothetical protein
MTKVGRKEILSEQLARQICRMIRGMADEHIPVDWNNIIAHAKKKFGKKFTRSMLSQKEWDGRKLIAEAFTEDKAVQKRMQSDTAPKYKTSARGVLQKRIMELEAKVLALQEELEEVRAQQFDKLDTFLTSGCDLRKLLDSAGKAMITRRDN